MYLPKLSHGLSAVRRGGLKYLPASTSLRCIALVKLSPLHLRSSHVLSLSSVSWKSTAGWVALTVPMVIWRIDAWPPMRDNAHTNTKTIPTTPIARSWNCDTIVLVSAVLAASISRIPTRSSCSRRQRRIAYVARPTISANKIGDTVGP